LSYASFIKKTIKLAEKGCGRVSPNPMVGAIITQNGEIIGKGYHKKFGHEHAEVVAINSAKKNVTGGTLFVNLEPCCHHGKQPPCVEAIVDSGIKKVVVGTSDPNPAVNGKGVQFLRNHGIDVEIGILEKESKELNAAFFKYTRTGQPFISLKIAQTLDGRIATASGESKWITSSDSRKYVHKMRAQNDVVLVGLGTVLKDDPGLSVRLVKGVNPKRVVLDSELRLPLDAKLLSDNHIEKTIIATTSKASPEKVKQIRDRGATVLKIAGDNNGQVNLLKLMKKLGQEGIISVLVEGGAKVFSSFLKAKLVDKLFIFIAPKILGDGLNAIQNLELNRLSDSLKLHETHIRKIGEDYLLTGNLLDA